jgi:hypothetical protein
MLFQMILLAESSTALKREFFRGCSLYTLPVTLQNKLDCFRAQEHLLYGSKTFQVKQR